MKRLFYLAGVAICATLLLGACSSSDDDTPAHPVNMELKQGNDARPSWQAPDYRRFEGMTMSIQIGLQKELLPYLSGNDLMCAMLAGEVRAVTPPYETGNQYYFPLSILGNSSEGSVTLKYYCDKLHRIFTVSDWKEFDSSIEPTIDGTPYDVKFYKEN